MPSARRCWRPSAVSPGALLPQSRPRPARPPAAMTRSSATESRPLWLVLGGEGVITGTVVCAAVFAYGAGHLESTGPLCLAILGTVAVYWVAHLHAVTLGSSFTQRHHPMVALRHALGETWPIAGASMLPVGVLLLAELAGAPLRTAAWVALIATIALLTAYS